MSPLWEADYGMRYDFFTVKSTDFSQSFGAFSPRLKITRFFGKRASSVCIRRAILRTVFARERKPVGFHLLNLPLQPTEAQFDLKPERDTQLEFGGHIPLGSGDLGFRIWQKNANNPVDDTQVGVTLLHQDINYVLGRLSQEALNYVVPLPRTGRAYFTAHVVSHNAGCETQLLASCLWCAGGVYTGRSRAALECGGRDPSRRSPRRLALRRWGVRQRPVIGWLPARHARLLQTNATYHLQR